MKKSQSTDNNDDITVEAPELENIFNFQLEENCYKNMWIDESNKIPYERWKTIEQKRWESFRAKCIDPKTGRWFTDGEGTGRCLGKEGPKRYVTTIIRLKSKDGIEYLLSNSKIIGYNQTGDPVTTTANLPERYNKTLFKFETVPNHETGYAERRNIGPCGTEIVYTLQFTKDDAQKLFDIRDPSIQFIVKSEDQGKVYDVKPQLTITETFKLFVESNFSYLYAANYMSKEEKEFNMRIAEGDGLIPKQSDDERAAAILAQQALSQKDKMASYG